MPDINPFDIDPTVLANALLARLDDRDRDAVVRKHAWCTNEVQGWTLLDTLVWLLRDGVYHERQTQKLVDACQAHIEAMV